MARVLHHFSDVIEGSEGTSYTARACCRVVDHTWEGWIEFVPVKGGPTIRTPRETTQPNFQDVAYWATGITRVYLEGALARAEAPVPVAPLPRLVETPAFSAPRSSILDPFSVFAKGEDLLRNELGALSRRHLLAIVEDFGLHPIDDPLVAHLSDAELNALIVSAVKERTRRAA